MGAVVACLARSFGSLRVDGQTCMVYSKLRCGDGCAGCTTKALTFVVNVFGTPWCLAFHVVLIYILPCLYFTWESFYYKVWRLLCGEHLQFRDARFPPDATSLGDVKATTISAAEGGVEWRRLTPEKSGDRVALFQDGIDPTDIAQGALGNCWLLSAAACLAEFDGAIQQLFLDKQANPRGKYRLWIYDVQRGRWKRIVVDDNVPTRNGKPVFSRPHGDEVWVLLLEKALAKFCGSYAAIESGHVIWAMEALTGDAVVSYQQQQHQKGWEHLTMKPKKDPQNKRAVGLYHSGRKFTTANMFALLCAYDRRAAVLGAGSVGKDDTLDEGRRETASGIVPGHAYSIISAAEHHGVKLVKLRNPWGTFEWKGKWADGADDWRHHPDVARAFRYKDDTQGDDDDGTFFMSWDDFCHHFDSIDVCLRTQGMSEFNLRVYEHYGLCGPTLGCLAGISNFLCLCKGLWKMWCGHYGTDDLVHDIERPFLDK